MARDKARDDKYFHCTQDHEINYVVGLYRKEVQEKVREIIKKACENNIFNYSTHDEVYKYINDRIE